MTDKPGPLTAPFETLLGDWMATAKADAGPLVHQGSLAMFRLDSHVATMVARAAV